MSINNSEVRAASIIRAMMEAACTSETSVDICLTTWQYIPEDSELHTRHHENLKFHKLKIILLIMNEQMSGLLNLIYGGRRNLSFKEIMTFTVQ
jgi:hypothetical protein